MKTIIYRGLLIPPNAGHARHAVYKFYPPDRFFRPVRSVKFYSQTEASIEIASVNPFDKLRASPSLAMMLLKFLKPTFSILILLLLPIFLKAQTPITNVSFNLNIPETSDNIYKARDYVKLSNGFTTTGQNFKAQIDESLVYPVNYVTAPTNPSAYNIDENLLVGAIPGQINVSQSGGAVYNIPIDLPTGTAGVQPQLSLVYNSQGNKGLLGWKWDLAGISAITRTGQNIYFDNNTNYIVNSPDYTSGNSFDDRFNLDGNRLVLYSGNYGELNSTYKKENDDLSIIKYLGKDAGFLVTTKDGIKIYYGNTADSRLLPVYNNYTGHNIVPVAWKINKIEDRFGNYMTYTYTNTNGESVISEVDYTGNTNANLSCYNKIKFYYQNKINDKSLYYIYGTKVVSEKILRKICVESSNTLINTYEFEYAEEFYTKLVKINKSGINGEKLNPTVIYYGAGAESDLKIDVSKEQFQYSPLDASTLEYFPTDFNGDGYTDLVGLEFYYATHNDIPQRKIYTQMSLKQNTKDSWNGLNWVSTIPLSGFEINLKEGTLPNSLGFSKADFNGDGIEDLLTYKTLLEADPYSSPGSVNQKINEVKILLGGKINPYSQSITYNNAFEPINEGAYFGVHYRSKLVTGDFDGDGNTDFIVLEYAKMRNPNNTSSYYSSKILFYSPSKINPRTIIYTPYPTTTNDCIENLFYNNELKDLNVSDINGNKKNEIIYTFVYDPTTIGIRAFELNDAGNAFNLILDEHSFISFENFQTADMNNDGYTDIISNQPFNTGDPVEHRIYYSNGYNINFGTFNSITTVKFGFNDAGNPDANENLMFIGDGNGDGYLDIINPISHNILANLIQGRNSSGSLFKLQKAGILEPSYSTITRASFIPGDFNGDGKLDFLYPRDGIYGLQYRIAYINSYKSDMYVNNIKDGFANEINIYNMPLTNDSIYFQSATNNEFNVAPIFCTYRIQQNNNNFYGNSIIYKYEDGVYFKERKSFGGFKYSSSHNFKNNIITETTYSKDFGNSYLGLLPIISTSKLFTNNQQLNSSSYIYAFHGGISDKAYRISISEITEYNSLNKVLKRSIRVVNADENLENETTDVGLTDDEVSFDIVQATSTSDYTYSTAGLTIPHKLETSSATTTYTGQVPYTSTESFTYHPSTGALFTRIKNGVTSTIALSDYNLFGLPLKTTVTSPNLLTKTEHFEYDNTGRFVTKIINPASYESTATYDQVLGVVKTKTDINNHTTKFEYNNFGNLIKTIAPNGVETLNSINWNDNTDIPDALYYTYSVSKYSNIVISPYVKKYFDKLAREVATETTDIDDNVLYTYTKYNNKGQVIEKWNPYFSTETNPLKTFYSYYPDDGRVNNVTEINGSFTHYDYNDSERKTTVSNSGTQQSKATTTNAMGQTISVLDQTGDNVAITYDYYSHGQPKSITSNGLTTSFEYDPITLMQTKLTDPDAGITEYEYDAYGQMLRQKDNKGNEYFFKRPTGNNDYYDVLGRLLKKRGPEGEYTYVYDSDPNNKGTLSKVVSSNEIVLYTYDNYGRILQSAKNVLDENFVSSYKYNNLGDLIEETYPGSSAFTIQNIYNNKGFLTQVNDKATNQPIWTILANKYNSKGQLKELTLGNGLTTYYDYNSFGFLNSIKTGTTQTTGLIQNYSYTFDADWGRPITRTNAFGGIDVLGNPFSVTETFGYDNDNLKLNRLSTVTVTEGPYNNENQAKNLSVNYALNGNISTKSQLGTYAYDGLQPHAVTAVENINNIISSDEQSIGYTPFNKVSYIKEKLITGSILYEKKLYFTYGTANQRIKTEYYDNDIQKTKYFAGNYEQEIIDGNVRELHYISGPMGLAAIYVKQDGNDTMYYIHTDHLGSITEITNEQGALLQRFAYDAWGKRSFITNNIGVNNFLFDRGYTGHEHLDQFALINMNGRLYDPILGRMLSPDNYVQNATSTQGFNRYSYCLNNPMIYTDPSGDFIGLPMFGLAFIGGTISNIINGVPNPIGSAYNDANTLVNGMSSCMQYPIYTDDNTTVSAGLDPFAFGVSANVYHTEGDFTFSGGAGVGLMSGGFANAGISYTSGDVTVGTGVGIGNKGGSTYYSFGGNATYKGYGLGYSFTHYGAGTTPNGQPIGAQNTGSFTGYWPGGSFRIENDIFAFDGQGQDRWRTSAWELTIGKYSLGSYIYTNDPEGEAGKYPYTEEFVDYDGESRTFGKNPMSYGDKMGAWKFGKVYSSPLWFGYRVGNTVSRIGFSDPLVQDLTQNFVHKYLGRENYYNQYSPSIYNSYFYSGYYNPYSLYGR